MRDEEYENRKTESLVDYLEYIASTIDLTGTDTMESLCKVAKFYFSRDPEVVRKREESPLDIMGDIYNICRAIRSEEKHSFVGTEIESLIHSTASVIMPWKYDEDDLKYQAGNQF